MRIMIMPTVGGTSHFNPRRPKYKAAVQAADPNFQTVFFGNSGHMMVLAEIEGVALAQLQLNLDVLTYDENLDAVPSSLTLFQFAHEQRSMPVDWMMPGMSLRVMTRRMITLFRIATSMGPDVFQSISYSAQIQDYGANYSSFTIALQNNGIDVNAIGPLMTVREALSIVYPQIDNTSISIAPWTI